MLRVEFDELGAMGFDLDLTGFAQFELANIFDDGVREPEESKTQEIDVDGFNADHQCPKCGFEFND
jgi:hypothetical protein